MVKKSACQCRRCGFNPWVWKIPWRREWQPTLVFLPKKPNGQRSLVGYSPRGLKESDTTEHTAQSLFLCVYIRVLCARYGCGEWIYNFGTFSSTMVLKGDIN